MDCKDRYKPLKGVEKYHENLYGKKVEIIGEKTV